MNEHTLHDPQLQSLEARLAAMPLQVSAGEQQQLLYQCAFAAGKKTSARSLRYWQAAAAVLMISTLGMSVPLARDEWLLATQRAKPPVPTKHSPAPAEMEPSPAPTLAQVPIPHRAPQVAEVDLDAWQLPPRNNNSFADEVARLENSDPHLRSLTVGTLTRAVLNP
jgi:hypothetical protein